MHHLQSCGTDVYNIELQICKVLKNIGNQGNHNKQDP